MTIAAMTNIGTVHNNTAAINAWRRLRGHSACRRLLTAVGAPTLASVRLANGLVIGFGGMRFQHSRKRPSAGWDSSRSFRAMT